VSSPRTQSSPAWERLVDVVLADQPDCTTGALFGMPCLKAAGTAFAGSFDGGAVFKLPEPSRSGALALAGAVLFDPSGKRPMKQWVVVPAAHEERWPTLVRDAWDYATS
jgi:hypothetical protein